MLLRSILTFALVMFIAGAVFQPAHAGNVLELEDGELILEKELQSPLKKRHNVTVLEAAEAYTDAWRQAMRDGEPVPVETITEHKPADGIAGLWAVQKTVRATKAVVYDSERGVVTVVDATAVIDTERTPNPLSWMVMFGIALASFSYHAARREHFKAAAVLSFFSAVAVLTSAVLLKKVFTISPLVFVFGILILFVALIFGNCGVLENIGKKSQGKHGVPTAVYTIAMVVAASTPWW